MKDAWEMSPHLWQEYEWKPVPEKCFKLNIKARMGTPSGRRLPASARIFLDHLPKKLDTPLEADVLLSKYYVCQRGLGICIEETYDVFMILMLICNLFILFWLWT